MALWFAVAGCGKSGCDLDEVDKVLSAIDGVRTDQKAGLSAAGISEACTNPEKAMPAALRAALAARNTHPPSMQLMATLKAVADAPGLWMAVCEGGLAAAAELGRVAPSQRGALLTNTCKLQSGGFASDSEIRNASVDAAILAAMTHHWLSTDGTDKKRARRLARGLLGL